MNMTATIQNGQLKTHPPLGSQAEEPKVGKLNQSGRKVTTEKGKAIVLGKGLTLKRKALIILRSIKKTIVITYYLVKAAISRSSVDSPEKLKRILNEFGPSLLKSMQVVLTPELIDNMAKFCLNIKNSYELSDNEKAKLKKMKDEFGSIFRNVELTKMPIDEAQKIINKTFEDKYKVIKDVGSGTIAACFEIEDKNGNRFIAKVMRDEHIDTMIEASYMMKVLNIFSSTDIRKLVQLMCEQYIEECSLQSESQKLSEYRNAMSNTENTVTAEFHSAERADGTLTMCQLNENNEKFEINFSVPELIEETRTDNVMIMKKAEGYTLSELNLDNELLNNEYEKLFCLKPNRVDVNQFLKAIRNQLQKKWSEMAFKEKLVHGDLHDGNVIISFNPENKSVNLSIIDFGCSSELTEEKIKILRGYSSVIDEFNSVDESERKKLDDIFEVKSFKDTYYDIIKKNKKLKIKPSMGSNILEVVAEKEALQVKKLFNCFISKEESKKMPDSKKEDLYRSFYCLLALHRNRECEKLFSGTDKKALLNCFTKILLNSDIDACKWLNKFLMAAFRSKIYDLHWNYLEENNS